MKTKFTLKSKNLAKALTSVVLLLFGSIAYAQAPFQGGQTYWINGSGVDVVAPKDTFVSFNGSVAYVTDAAYVTGTGLAAALNSQGVDPTTLGTVNIVLAPGYVGFVESGQITIGQTVNGGYPFMSALRPIVIKPAPGSNFNITSAAITGFGALLRLSGAQFVTIDGEGTPGQRNISFIMPAGSTANNTKVIDIISTTNTGCQSITIKNCNIKGLSTAGASATITTYAGIYAGGGTAIPQAPLRTSQNFTFINNVIEAAQFPIYVRGRENLAGQQDLNLVVRNNILGGTIQPVAGEVSPTTFIGGAANAAGITLIAQKNAIVEGNTIRNNLPSQANFRGISLVSATSQTALNENVIVNANKIYNLRSTTAGSGVYGIRINMGAHVLPLSISVTNNTIAKLITNSGGTAIGTLSYPVGIAVEDNSTNAGINIYHNSVHLYGDTMSGASFSACLFTGSTTTGGVRVANNIFVNRMGRSVFSTGATPTAYIYIANSTVKPYQSIRNNSYYTSNMTAAYSFIGYLRKAHPSIDNWKMVTLDTGSINALPPFVGVDDTTLTITNGVAGKLGTLGMPLNVTSDMNGLTRSTVSPSVGAYEFSSDIATANYPLAGGMVYAVNGTSSWPAGANAVGTFATLADAIGYLNTFGVTGTGNITLELSSGYSGETALIPAITFYSGADSTRTVVIRPSAGNSYTVTTPASFTSINSQYAVLNMIGAKFVTIDGQSVAGQRNLTFSLPAALTSNTLKVIAIASGDTASTSFITVKNCNIIGASTTSAINTAFGIYQGHYNPSAAFQSSTIGRNNNISITNNYIQAVRSGIYLRGANIQNAQNRNITINRNVIGGDIKRGQGAPITYVGGLADQAGIYLKAIANAVVDSNIIRNSDSLTANSGFRGIDLDLGAETNAVDSFITLSRNTIYNLTSAGNYSTGIRVSLGSQTSRRITIVNNSISKIMGIGAATTGSASNPAGIMVDGTGAVSDLNMDIYNNTIQMNGNRMSASNSSYALYFGAAIQGGVRVQGNLLSNKLGRTSALNGFAYALFSNTAIATSPFRLSTGGFINSNSYGTDANNTQKAIIGTSATNYTLVAQWQAAMLQDNASYSFVPVFSNDSMPFLDPVFAGPLYNGSLTVPGVTTDIAGTPRGGVTTCMGALQFTINFLPLAGNSTYYINGVNNYPIVGGTPPYSFATVNNAIKYINANGVDNISPTPQPITLMIDAGYVGEGDTLISPLVAYPRMNASRIITLTNNVGRNDTITTGKNAPYATNGSLFRFFGGSYFVIDGTSGGTSTGRNLTLKLPDSASANVLANNLKVIDFTPGEKVVTTVKIRNCNIIGNTTGGTINTFAGVYTGGIATTPSNPVLSKSNNIVIENNSITGVRYGVYAQGVSTALGQQDLGLVVRGNYIGKSGAGVANQFGGAANAAGIYLSAQINSVIDSNVITNNVTGATFTANRGIELAATPGNLAIDSNISITRNTITKISNNTAAGAAYGVLINLAGDSLARITLANNMISGITAAGTASTPSFSTASPFGIFVDASSSVNNLGLNIWYNSINLGSDTSLKNTNNGISACVAFNSNVRGGVAMSNNILQNRLGGRVGGTSSSYSIFVGHTANIFTVCDNNSYFAEAPGISANNKGIAVMAATTTPVRYNTYDQWSAFTKQDTMSLYFVTKFVNDSNLLLDGPQHLVYGWGKYVPAVTNDINGDVRTVVQQTIGADELSFGLYADSIAPRIFNITKTASTCNNGPFDIVYRVFERPNSINSGFDTLYYKLNNGADQYVVGATTVNGFTRTYRIPAQPINTSIAYRLAVNDNSNQTFRSIYPASGESEFTSSIFSQFPITYGFDLPNYNGWKVENFGPNGTVAAGGWRIDTYGSPLNPVATPNTGIKAALFEAFSLPTGTMSRLVSPCLDFTNMKVPTVRLWISQNGEALTKNDLVRVTVSGGLNLWSAPIGSISRPKSGLAFPAFGQLDVCLANFVGINGIKIGIEALSANGNNIVLDSIVIFDDVLNYPISPLATTICDYNPLSVSIPTSSTDYKFTLVDAFTADPLGSEVNGTGSAMSITAPNPSNPFIGRVDSSYVVVRYDNIRSGCFSYLPDTSKVQIRSFYGGPYMTKGTPFSGSFNAGTIGAPDGVTIGDTATYSLVPPSGLTNADYGTKWTIISTQAKSDKSNFAIASTTFTPPNGSINASYQLRPTIAEVDSAFKISVSYRLLPSNCDSVAVRYLKVTSAPAASFTSADSTCPGVPIYFTNTTTFLPYTAPLTYIWEFGDGTIATTKDANKTYSIFTVPGTYTVRMTAYNNAGVSNVATKQIVVKAVPYTAFVSGKACGTDSIQFTNTSVGAISYLWTNKLGGVVKASSTLENPKFSFAIADTLYDVTLRATNDLGCSKDSVIGTFSFSKPVASFSTVNQCVGLQATFNNTTTIAPGLNGRINTFGSEWDFGNGDFGLSNNPVYTYPTNGTYTVKLRVTSNYGCMDSTTRTLVVYDKPLAGFTTGVACQDAVVDVNNTTTYAAGLNKVLFDWNFGDFSPASDEFEPVKTYTSIGTFAIRLIAKDTVNFCSDTIIKQVEVNEVPVALFAANDGCVNSPVQFNNGSIPPVGQTLSYSWDFGGGNTSTDTNPTFTYASQGTKSITLTSTTNKGCSDIVTNSINVLSVPSATFTIDSVDGDCNKKIFEASTKGLGGYEWDFGDGSTARGDSVTNTFQYKGKYTVTLKITSGNCQATHTEEDSIYCTVGIEEAFVNKFNLSVYPNPFENVSNISYNLDSKKDVTIVVMDMLGRTVSEFTERNQSAGSHTIKLDESSFTSTAALYMVRIKIGDESITKQLLHK